MSVGWDSGLVMQDYKMDPHEMSLTSSSSASQSQSQYSLTSGAVGQNGHIIQEQCAHAGPFVSVHYIASDALGLSGTLVQEHRESQAVQCTSRAIGYQHDQQYAQQSSYTTQYVEFENGSSSQHMVYSPGQQVLSTSSVSTHRADQHQFSPQSQQHGKDDVPEPRVQTSHNPNIGSLQQASPQTYQRLSPEDNSQNAQLPLYPSNNFYYQQQQYPPQQHLVQQSYPAQQQLQPHHYTDYPQQQQSLPQFPQMYQNQQYQANPAPQVSASPQLVQSPTYVSNQQYGAPANNASQQNRYIVTPTQYQQQSSLSPSPSATHGHITPQYPQQPHTPPHYSQAYTAQSPSSLQYSLNQSSPHTPQQQPPRPQTLPRHQHSPSPPHQAQLPASQYSQLVPQQDQQQVAYRQDTQFISHTGEMLPQAKAVSHSRKHRHHHHRSEQRDNRQDHQHHQHQRSQQEVLVHYSPDPIVEQEAQASGHANMYHVQVHQLPVHRLPRAQCQHQPHTLEAQKEKEGLHQKRPIKRKLETNSGDETTSETHNSSSTEISTSSSKGSKAKPLPTDENFVAQRYTPNVLGLDNTVENHMKEIKTTLRDAQHRLEEVSVQLKSASLPLTPQQYEMICTCLDSANRDLLSVTATIKELETERFVSPATYADLRTNVVHAHMLARVVDLYRQEADWMVKTSHYEGAIFAELFITEQPFPSTIKQHLNVGFIELKLLTGARTNIKVLGLITADVIGEVRLDEGKKRNKRSIKKLEGNEEEVINPASICFNRMKFLVGTNCKPIKLIFKMLVESAEGNNKMLVESQVSEPFVVMTNTKQWYESQGSLMRLNFFHGLEEIPLNNFINLLQHNYLCASKQTAASATRLLSIEELEFICFKMYANSFPGATHVSQHDFAQFWNWFGLVLQKIRFHKCILPMWTKGLIWGLISKERTEELLNPHPAGTFLLRFSVREEIGGLAIAYKQSNTSVRHYLMKSRDTMEQGKSVPQFIRDAPSLLKFLQLRIHQKTLTLETQLIDKMSALETISNKRRKLNRDETSSSYDEDLQDLDIQNLHIR